MKLSLYLRAPLYLRTLAAALLAAALASAANGNTGAAGNSAKPGTLTPIPPAPPAFAQCLGCHTVQPGRNAFGPSLWGVAGRKAGTAPGYSYSPALKSSGIVWTPATLDRWLAAPRKLVPGTKMPLMGVPDPAKRQQVIEYLQQLK